MAPKTKLFRTITAVAAMATVFLGASGIASAQMSVGATPLKTVLELNPGESSTFQVKAINRNDRQMTYKVEAQTAEAEGEYGNATFRPAEEDELYAVPNWITIDNPQVTVPAFEMAPVNFSITVPADTPPGGYYGMLLFSPANVSGDDGNVAIVGQIGTPILVEVLGDVVEEATLDSFDLEADKLEADGPIVFAAKFTNNGNVHLLPEGKIFLYQEDELIREVAQIKKEDGSYEVVDYVPLNPGKGYTLRESTRIYNPKWESNHRYGDITARYSFSYGKSEIKTVEGEKEFSLSKDITIEEFSYNRADQTFDVTIKNEGVIGMPLRGQIQIFPNAGGDPRVTISFPSGDATEIIASGQSKSISVPWEGIDVLKPTEENPFHAIMSYTIDKETQNIKTARAELPTGDYHGAAGINLEEILPYALIGLLLLVVAVLLFQKKKPQEPMNMN